MKITLTLHHENPLFLREFVDRLKKKIDSEFQQVSDDSYVTRNELAFVEELLQSAGFSGTCLRMQREGHRHACCNAAARIKFAADRSRIRCCSILEHSPRDHEDRTIERANGQWD